MNNNTIQFTVYTADGDEIEHAMPARFEVCPTCQGRGTHVNRAIDGNGITASEMEELGDDFREDYMRGVYDVTCEECRGRNVVAVADPERASPEVKAAWEQHMIDEDIAAREYASEATLRRMESGERW